MPIIERSILPSKSYEFHVSSIQAHRIASYYKHRYAFRSCIGKNDLMTNVFVIALFAYINCLYESTLR